MSNAAHQANTKRLHQLNLIKHFIQSSQSLMLVLGKENSGKTELLTDTVLQMRASRKIIRLQGMPNLHPSQLVNVLSKHWAIGTIDPRQRVENQLDDMLEGLMKYPQSCILIIDDAHLLPLSVLAAISHLMTQQDGKRIYLHIVLTGDPILTEKINRLQTKEIPCLIVGVLSDDDTFRKMKPSGSLSRLEPVDISFSQAKMGEIETKSPNT